ncbi:methylmalonyl-CoA mutase family protein [Caulobacter segnis]
MTDTPYQHAPDPPWIFRTYAGHSTAEKSNALYRANLARGQTGLSVAFDLPDPDRLRSRPHPGARRGRQGRRARSAHLGDMRALSSEIPLEQMNTSDDHQRPGRLAAGDVRGPGRGAGAPTASCCRAPPRTTSIKEYLSRGTYVFPPAPGLRLIGDMIAW